MTIRLIRAARRDVLRAALWYDSKKPGLGDRLLEVIGLALRDIREHPEAHPPLDEHHRRKLTRVFPYALIYRIEGDTIWIVAVAHTSRRPNFWRRRRVE